MAPLSVRINRLRGFQLTVFGNIWLLGAPRKLGHQHKIIPSIEK